MDIVKGVGMAVGGLVIGFVVVILGIVGIFLFAIFGALIGAITGWILSNTPILGDLVRTGFTSVLEVESPDLVAIGAMLGFIAGFFKNWEHKQECKHHCKHEKMENCCEGMSEKFEKMEDIPEVHIDIKPKGKKKK